MHAPSPVRHGVMDQGRPVLVELQRARVADDDEGAARTREAHVDAALIRNKADAPLAALAECPGNRKCISTCLSQQ